MNNSLIIKEFVSNVVELNNQKEKEREQEEVFKLRQNLSFSAKK